MRHIYVVDERDVEADRAEGDTALVKLTLGPHTGSQLLEQRVIRYGQGTSLPRSEEERDELLFVVAGTGALELEGERHRLEPDSGVYVRAGETYSVANEGSDELLVVSTTVPVEQVYRPSREVVVRFDEQAELRADAKRTFRYLVNQDAGCMDATQFLGIVEPCRAPDHSHCYDEVGYVVEGGGFAHIGGESMPLRAGSCFHLPPEQVHCIENTGPGVMRILGVFHPSGDPASRVYDEAATTAPA